MLVTMPPSLFLDLVGPGGWLHEPGIKEYEELLLAGADLFPLWLQVESRAGTLETVDHDGRHRALAAIRDGEFETIPVQVVGSGAVALARALQGQGATAVAAQFGGRTFRIG